MTESALPTMVIGFIRGGSAQGSARWGGGLQKGFSEPGYVEGKSVAVGLEGKDDRLPELLADLVRRQVAVIATLSTIPTQVAQRLPVSVPNDKQFGVTSGVRGGGLLSGRGERANV